MGGGQPVADNDPPGGQQNLSPLSCVQPKQPPHILPYASTTDVLY